MEGGTELSDEVALTNFGTEPATFAVYGGDGTLSPDGSFDLAPSDQEPTGGGSWITVLPAGGSEARDGGGLMLEVPGQTTVAIPVEIRVPADATPGDHPAGIVAELADTGTTSVRMTSRVGVRAHLRVTGDILAQLTHEQVSATYAPSWNPFAPGTTTITYTVVNSGNVRLGADSAATVSGPFGLFDAESLTEDREILPGDPVSHTVAVPTWPTVHARGSLTSTPGIVGEDVVDVPLAAATSTVSVWAVPWSQLALLALICGALLLFRRHRRRAAQKVQDRIAAAVAAATGSAAAADVPEDTDPGLPDSVPSRR
ncbi:hypothetical protein FE251_00610 [Georgenia wutianyii]|uniref:DUF916 domain-containing protein n=1 Tax=Georgenia wutianyii TaxID=2585135 RepID=A0ABX5VK02_9MICO|nr:hypothetical protein [Georgenia wutianyii]QDB78051.1 hypothetical protein FE251_00610 [Georgenia wutianyii]